MIDIVFSDSACGSLKMAQHYGEGKYQDECSGILVSHADGSKPSKEEIEVARREAQKRAHLAWENATPLGGDPADIYGLNLVLSVGDISEDQPGLRRKQTLENLYSIYPNDEGRQAAQEILKRVNEDMKTIRERAAEGESFRIWYSNYPDEMCGFYWFMSQLNQWKVRAGQVSTVKLPEWETDKAGNIVQKIGWCDVATGEWHRYLTLQKPTSPVFEQSCASYWQELQRENAPLRATLNGKLVSTPETLYDDFIFREIAAEDDEFQEAMVIGRVLGRYQLGISDSLVALRIEEMIRVGRLEAVTAVAKDMPKYYRILKKSTPNK